MTFEVEVNGRVRQIAVEPAGAAGPDGGTFRVRVDGVPCDVSARATDLGLSLLFLDTGRSVDAAVTARPGGHLLVQLSHVDVGAVVDGRRYARAGAGPSAAAGVQRISAPMPGRIVRVLVAVGDEVADRQGLVVIEAMKMENELRSPKAGRVKEVAVAVGTSVEAGRLLVVVE